MNDLKVGTGATISLYSDRNAYTIIAVSDSKKTITLQRDTATLNKEFKPEMVKGGFVGHVLNNDEQTYSYEANPEGAIVKARLGKDGKYYARKQSTKAIRIGVRSEFYDYNF